MVNSEQVKKVLFWFILILFAVLVAVFLRTDIYTHDDWYQAFFYKKDIVWQFLNADHGRVWSWFVMKFWAHIIPAVFHINPQQNIFGAIIRGINFAILVFLLTGFYSLGQKNKYNAGILLVNIFVVTALVLGVTQSVLIHYNQHFAYLFNYLIFLVIWFVWYGEFLQDKFCNGNHKIRDAFFAFILAFCGHFVNIPSLVMLFGLFIYKSITTDRNYFKSFKNTTFQMLPIILPFIVALLIHFNLPGFTLIRAARLPQEPILTFIVSNFFEYTKLLFNAFFIRKYAIVFNVLIILSFISFCFQNKKDKGKYIFIAFCLLISEIIFQYSLIACGTTYYAGKLYWIESRELMFFVRLNYLLILNVLKWGYLFKYNKYVTSTVLILLFVIFCTNYTEIKIRNDIYEYKTNIQRKTIYKIQKLYRYYDLKQEKVSVPLKYMLTLDFELNPVWEYAGVEQNCALVFKSTRKLNIINKNLINENEIFSKEELENIDFQKLYDNDFVLNMPRPEFR